jgi:hypothetical protein
MSTIEDTDARIEFERANWTPTDLELEPITSEDEDYESAPPDYQISTYPADFTLEVLHQKWKSDEILIPDFQRKFVWKQVQASKLIESFLVGLPVPAVFLYSEWKSQKFLVIDGQQRLKSIFYFVTTQVPHNSLIQKEPFGSTSRWLPYKLLIRIGYLQQVPE